MRFNSKSNRWKRSIYIAVPIVALVAAGLLTNTMPPTNVAQTTPDEAPELRTRVYSQSLDAVFAAAQTVAGEQKTWFRTWRVNRTDDDTIHVEVPVIFFTDDLTIRVEESDGQTRVNVESKSRVGQGDFGENRRHIAQFLRALDEKLAN